MKKLFLAILFFLSLATFAQDVEYAKTVIEKLCSDEFAGRGYVNAGDKKAAHFIENQFTEFGLIALDTQMFKSANHHRKIPKYTQEFTMGINSFPGDVFLGFDKRVNFVLGKDYFIGANSGSIESTQLDLYFLTKKDIKSEKNYDKFENEDYTDKAVVIDLTLFEKYKDSEFLKYALENSMRADALIILQPGNLVWRASRKALPYPVFYMKKDKFPKGVTFARVKVESKYIRAYRAQNVIGMVKGKTYPDKYVVVCAHYDHLGMMGKNVMFPGANDNASGTAMMLDLAKYYADPFNQPEYSMLFIGFAAEEAGLVGSEYFVDNPLIPLLNIRFLINLDMMSSGEGGLMVVNASSNKPEWEKIKQINEQKKYFTNLQSRGPAANSDHHYFHKAGVPAFFLYLMGIKDKEYFYHNPGDVPKNVSLAGYNAAFKLITDFIGTL